MKRQRSELLSEIVGRSRDNDHDSIGDHYYDAPPSAPRRITPYSSRTNNSMVFILGFASCILLSSTETSTTTVTAFCHTSVASPFSTAKSMSVVARGGVVVVDNSKKRLSSTSTLKSTSSDILEKNSNKKRKSTTSAKGGGVKIWDEKMSFLVNPIKASEQRKEMASKRQYYWLRWMMTGKKAEPRGVADVRMREAAELGGLPRNDRYSSRDWVHNTLTLPNSAILRNIRGPVIFMTLWATFLSIIYDKVCTFRRYIRIPSTTPHSLMVSALGLLLVFRTNSAYQRFAEGRKIWGEIVNSARDLYRTIMLYENEIGVDKRRRLQRLLAAFPYLLRHRIRPNLLTMYEYGVEDNSSASESSSSTSSSNKRDPENTILLYQDRGPNDMDPELAALATNEEENNMLKYTSRRQRKTRPLYWVDKRTLPWRLLPGTEALKNCARAQNRPLWVCDRMAEELVNVPDGPNFSARERLALISHVHKLSRYVGECERIHQTAVPLNYARHSLRALTLWLLTLPLALVDEMRYLTGPVLLLVSWLLFGVYEIGYAIEDPFQGTLRLSILCDMIRRDVLADEIIRNTAFQLESEQDKKKQKNDGSGNNNDDDDAFNFESEADDDEDNEVDDNVEDIITNDGENDTDDNIESKNNNDDADSIIIDEGNTKVEEKEQQQLSMREKGEDENEKYYEKGKDDDGYEIETASVTKMKTTTTPPAKLNGTTTPPAPQVTP